MRPIQPDLFARLMRLPDSLRVDLLEFVGATPLADAQIARMIDELSARPSAESRGFASLPN